MKELIYSKFSNERDRKFSIRTDIYEEEGKRFVKKAAVYPEGQAHVKNLLRWYQELDKLYENMTFSCNVCTEEADGMWFEYVEGGTLEEYLDALIAEDKISETKQHLASYLKCVKKAFSIQKFEMTEVFQQVFGEQSLPEGFFSAAVTNIDMVCSNLVLGDSRVVLDYEWTFDFPIPVEFVLYRIIFYYLQTHREEEVEKLVSLYEEFGITEDLKTIFADMEQCFQGYIEGSHIPMRNMFDDMTPGIKGVQQDGHGNGKLQVYFSSGDGYSEEDSVRLSIKNHIAVHSISLPTGCKELRIDPGDEACAVKIQKLALDGRNIDLSNLQIPEGVLSGEWIYIAKADPNIGGILVPESAKKLEVELEIYPGNEMLLRNTVDKINEMQVQVQKLERLKKTKWWKMYQVYRKVMKKNHGQ